MTGMSTETLTGRDLDVAVAEAMGHGWQGGNPIPGLDGRWPWPPPYSSADCSGLAPVLAWLEANAPTAEQARRATRYRGTVSGAWLKMEYDDGRWRTCYVVADESGQHNDLDDWQFAPTLPAAAARLLVAWTARKGRES